MILSNEEAIEAFKIASNLDNPPGDRKRAAKALKDAVIEANRELDDLRKQVAAPVKMRPPLLGTS